jgi:hypothetical protein
MAASKASTAPPTRAAAAILPKTANLPPKPAAKGANTAPAVADSPPVANEPRRRAGLCRPRGERAGVARRDPVSLR